MNQDAAITLIERIHEEFGPDLEQADPASLNRRASQLLAEGGFYELGFLTDQNFNPADIRQLSQAIDALSYRSPVISSVYLVSAVFCGLCISLLGTREQKDRLLGGLARGETLLAFAMTEPQAGSDVTAIESGFSRDGNDIIVSGNKQFITGSSVADSILLICREFGDDIEPRSLSIVELPTNAEGLTVEPMPKLSANAQPSCRITMNNIRLPAERILGGPAAAGKAFMALRLAGGLERLSVAISSTAGARRAYDLAADFAREREQFGQKIARHQAIQHRLVDMATTLRTMELLTEDAIASAASGEMSALKICMAKAWCAEKMQEIVQSAMRIYGGRGYFLENEIAHLYQGAPLSLYAGGTTELQKNMIARELKL